MTILFTWAILFKHVIGWNPQRVDRRHTALLDKYALAWLNFRLKSDIVKFEKANKVSVSVNVYALKKNNGH